MDRWEGNAPGTAAYSAGEGDAAPAPQPGTSGIAALFFQKNFLAPKDDLPLSAEEQQTEEKQHLSSSESAEKKQADSEFLAFQAVLPHTRKERDEHGE